MSAVTGVSGTQLEEILGVSGTKLFFEILGTFGKAFGVSSIIESENISGDCMNVGNGEHATGVTTVCEDEIDGVDCANVVGNMREDVGETSLSERVDDESETSITEISADDLTRSDISKTEICEVCACGEKHVGAGDEEYIGVTFVAVISRS